MKNTDQVFPACSIAGRLIPSRLEIKGRGIFNRPMTTELLDPVLAATHSRLLANPNIRGVRYSSASEGGKLVLTPEAPTTAPAAWEALCDDERFAATTSEIEITPDGKITMSPPALNYHGRMEMKIGQILGRLAPHGEAASEIGINTPHGLFVADVVWVVGTRADVVFNERHCSTAPELCVEIWSASNTPEEFQKKRAAYFAAGALEVWEVTRSGDVSFFLKDAPDKDNGASRLVLMFPKNVQHYKGR